MQQQKVDRYTAVLLFLIAISYHSSYILRFALGPGDESYHYYIGLALYKGQTPYSDIQLYNYLPTLFYPYAAVFKIFGPSVFAARLISLATISITPVLFFITLRSFCQWPIAVLFTLINVLVPGPWINSYTPFFSTLTILLALHILKNNNRLVLFFFGFVFGIALFVRADLMASMALILFLTICFKLYLTNVESTSPSFWQLCKPLCISFCISSIPVFVFLGQEHILKEFFLQYFDIFSGGTIRVFYEHNIQPPAFSELFNPSSSTRGFALIYYGSFFSTLCLMGYIAVQLFHWRTPSVEKRFTLSLGLVVFWVLLNTPQYAFDRPGLHHIAQRTTAIFLPVAIITQLLFNAVKQQQKGWYLAACIMLALWVYPYYYVSRLMFPITKIMNGNEESEAQIKVQQLSNGMRYPGTDKSKMFIEYIIHTTPPDERMGAYPYSPYFNFLSGRLMPNRHVHLIPDFTDREVEQEMLTTLAHVNYVVYNEKQNIYQNNKATWPEIYMPLIHHRLKSDYAMIAKLGHWQLLKKNHTFDTPSPLPHR